jgi:hypothetical protein
MATYTDVSIAGVGKWCDPDHKLNANTTSKELAGRKDLANLTTPENIYIRKYKDDVIDAMVAGGVDPKQCKCQPMYMRKYYKDHMAGSLDPKLQKQLEQEALANRTKIHDAIREWKGLSRKGAGKSGGRAIKEAAEGWLRAPPRVLEDGKQRIAFYYHPSTKTCAQMRPVEYTEVDDDGIPIPPDGMMVKGKRGPKRKADSEEPKPAEDEEEAEEDDSGDD